MSVYQLRIGYLPFSGRLYRVLSVPGNLKLDTVSYLFLIAFEARCNKLYSYHVGDRRIVSRIDFPLAHSLDSRYELDSEVSLSSLNLKKDDVFWFHYGRGGDISFEVRVDNVFSDDTSEAVLNDGRGAGIIEDNRAFLDYYLENEMEEYLYSPLIGRKVKREDYFGFDFDRFDVDAANYRLKEYVEKVRHNYQEATPMLPCF